MQVAMRNLYKYYGDSLILNIESLDLAKNKITGVLGPNGAGKSTLLNIIGGLDSRYDGLVTYDGASINRDIYTKMTVVSQNSYLFKTSVYKNLEYPLKIRNTPEKVKEALINDVLDRLKIAEFIGKKGHQLSAGQSQKVALARALIIKPDLLLLDEPTSNIDAHSKELIENEISQYNRETNGTVIMITHSLKQANRLCHQLVVLENGRVES